VTPAAAARALRAIVDATLASLVIVLLLIALTYYSLPWRRLPDADAAPAPAPVAVEPLPSLPRPPTAVPDAYAESP